MTRGIYPQAAFLPTINFGYPQGTHGQMQPLGFCDHIAEGSKATVDAPGFWEGQGTSAHFIIGKDGSVSQFVNLFDIAWSQGLVASNLDLDNPIINAARCCGGVFQLYHGDNSGRLYAVDGDGCNVFNRSFISIEHAGFPWEPWTPAMLRADIDLKRWVMRELTAANLAFPLDSIDRLIGHRMLDPKSRAQCPGSNWPREEIWAALTASAASGISTYTVRPGDTLAGIATTLGISLDRLLAANPQIYNPNLISVGQQLVIPDQDGSSAAATAGETAYAVQPGDTVAAIAARFGIALDALLASNPQVYNPSLIYVGQQLTIPSSGGPPVRITPTPSGSLSNEPDAFLGFHALWPWIQVSAASYGADSRMLAAIVHQESGFTNWRVHRDGTGHGLIGLDDNGLLPDFERWSGLTVGRGQNARSIPPERQIEYLARTIAAMASAHGGDFLAAARQWHAGGGGIESPWAYRYQSLIESHIKRLFG